MAEKLQRGLMEYFVVVLCSGEGQVQRDGREVAARPDGIFCCWFVRPVHPPYSSVFVTEFNPEYGNTDLLI